MTTEKNVGLIGSIRRCGRVGILGLDGIVMLLHVEDLADHRCECEEELEETDVFRESDLIRKLHGGMG